MTHGSASVELRQDAIRVGDVTTRWSRRAFAVAALGLVATLGLVASDPHAAERFWRSWLVNLMFCLSLALGALFFVIVSHLVRAGWSVALRRIAEVLAWTIGPLLVPALLLLVGMHELYEWSERGAVAADALLQHKRPWLNPTFFTLRFFGYFAAWSGLAWYYLRGSLRQDESHDPEATLRMERASAPAAIVFAMTITFAAFDWMMSLDPHWYSTIYGVHFFAGCVVGVLSLIVLLAFGLQRAGKLADVIHVEHYHDLGKLVFAFVVFWAYIAFSQYMLMWYGNIPEETVWYKLRQTGSWVGVSLLLLFGHFFVPFLGLMSRHAKRRRGVLAAGAVWVLIMHWLDLYWQIMPAASPGDAWPRALDLSCLLLIGGWFLGTALWRMGRGRVVPVGDPRLAESLGFGHG